MLFVNIEKRNPLKDDLIVSAIIDLMGGALIFYITAPLGFVGFLFSAFMYVYFVVPSVVLASIRYRLIGTLNHTRNRMQDDIRKILKTEILIKNKERSIYKRRIELLKKNLENLTNVYSKVDQAFSVAKNMRFETIHEVTRLMEIASKYEEAKVFSDKK